MSAFPTITETASVTLSSNQPTRTSTTHSFRRVARSVGTQRWGIKIMFPPLQKSRFMQFFAFLMSMRGQADPFTIILPNHAVPAGTWSGAPAVNGAGQTGRTINMNGFVASQAFVAKAGDFIKFNGHSKVYMVTADAASDGAGAAAITIEPALLQSIASGELLTTKNVPFNVAQTSDGQSTTISPGGFYSLDIDLIEVW